MSHLILEDFPSPNWAALAPQSASTIRVPTTLSLKTALFPGSIGESYLAPTIAKRKTCECASLRHGQLGSELIFQILCRGFEIFTPSLKNRHHWPPTDADFEEMLAVTESGAEF